MTQQHGAVFIFSEVSIMGLFKPVWMGENKAKAIRAVEKESNQTKLLEIIKTAPLLDVRITAINQLTDQSSLAIVAEDNCIYEIQQAAINKLNDFNILNAFSDEHNWKSESIRNDAVSRLRELIDSSTDQLFLAHFASSCLNSTVAASIADKLTEHSVLLELAKNAETAAMRVAVLDKLDQSEILDEAMTNSYDYVRTVAVRKLTDNAILLGIVKSANVERYTREEAVRQIADHDTLVEIINSIKDSDFRIIAIQRLTNQETLADIAKRESNFDVLSTLIEKLTDQGVLASIAKGKPEKYVRIRKAMGFYGDDYSDGTYEYDKKENLLIKTIDKINDKNLLADIMENAADESIRKAAKERLANLK